MFIQNIFEVGAKRLQIHRQSKALSLQKRMQRRGARGQ